MEHYKYEVLDWCDGANLILIIENNNIEYIAMLEPPGDWYLGALINSINKKLFLDGKVDLRKLFLSSDLYKFTLNEDCLNDFAFKKEELEKENLKESYLPLEGYYFEK